MAKKIHHKRKNKKEHSEFEEEVLQVAIERGHTETVSALLRTNRLSLPSVQRAISAAADEPEIADILTQHRNNNILSYGTYAVLGLTALAASYWAYLAYTGGES